ncbi:hypothetical protein MKW98_017396, partial [Papaver atlanticum]
MSCSSWALRSGFLRNLRQLPVESAEDLGLRSSTSFKFIAQLHYPRYTFIQHNSQQHKSCQGCVMECSRVTQNLISIEVQDRTRITVIFGTFDHKDETIVVLLAVNMVFLSE